MKKWFGSVLPALAFALFLSGCGPMDHHHPSPSSPSTKPTTPEEEAKLRANLDKLDPEDRKIAEQQKYCAIDTGTRLGAMDTPIKLMLDGQPVFVCCKSCKKDAEKDKEKTLATAKELRDKNTAP